MNWLQIQHLRDERARPFQIMYKETLNDLEAFKVLDIRPKKRPDRLLSLLNIEQVLLYPDGRKVAALKKRDMLELLKFIPVVHDPFFEAIQTDAAANEDFDGYQDEESD